jgi:hypothetical protein
MKKVAILALSAFLSVNILFAQGNSDKGASNEPLNLLKIASEYIFGSSDDDSFNKFSQDKINNHIQEYLGKPGESKELNPGPIAQFKIVAILGILVDGVKEAVKDKKPQLNQYTQKLADTLNYLSTYYPQIFSASQGQTFLSKAFEQAVEYLKSSKELSITVKPETLDSLETFIKKIDGKNSSEKETSLKDI